MLRFFRQHRKPVSGLSALKTGIEQFISGPAKTQRHQVRAGSQVIAQWAAVLAEILQAGKRTGYLRA